MIHVTYLVLVRIAGEFFTISATREVPRISYIMEMEILYLCKCILIFIEIIDAFGHSNKSERQ